jgi:hypothetical protein
MVTSEVSMDYFYGVADVKPLNVNRYPAFAAS